MTVAEIDDRIREVLEGHARLPEGTDALASDTDLYQAGMSSHASVSVMLALEDAFDVEFPDEMLTRDVFASISAIREAVTDLGASG